MNASPLNYPKIKLCVSGAAEMGHCGIDAPERAMELGREIARHGCAVTTGATTGFPLWAAMGAKEAGGISIGLSPASSEKEHLEVYKLPTDYMDIVIYTGFGYPGRDLLLTRASDAVLIGCGRIGTIHEFTIAFEDRKPIGVLQGSWEMDDELKLIIEDGHRPSDLIVFDEDPKRLVEKVIALVERQKAEHPLRPYLNHDEPQAAAASLVSIPEPIL